MKISRVQHKDDGRIMWGFFDGHFYPFAEPLFESLASGKKPEDVRCADTGIDAGFVRMLAPTVPTKIAAVGLNYRGHAAEMKKDIPAEPLIFLKPPSAVIGHNDAIVRPAGAVRVDYEGELAVVIGRRCRNVSPEDAGRFILGYACFNDVTEREIQKRDIQYARAKGFDTFAPCGPVIETALNPDAVSIETMVNGVSVQRGHTSDMIFSVRELVGFISRVMTLEPGDIISTGTPAGIGPLQSGDRVDVAIEGVGILTNRVIDSDGQRQI